MKYFILFLAFLFPAVSFAQTPGLFDEWSPALAGSLAHFQISKDEITITFPSRLGALGTIITMPAPVTAPSIVAKSDPIVAKTEKVKLLKVIYDSAQSKGRMFVRVDKADSMILPLSFLIKDNGEAEIGLAVDPFTLMMGGQKMKTLKEAEKATRPNAKNKNKNFGMVLTHGEIDGFKNFTFTFYNSSRTAEFAKLKDPTTMPKEEVIGMMNSFGDRLAAELQALPQDSADNNPFAMFSYFVPLFKNVQHVANDLFIAHGYNPLGAASCIEKFKGDSDIEAAGKILGEKIEQSVPALRKEKAERDERKRVQDSADEVEKAKFLLAYGNDAEGVAQGRKLMDLKSSVYDETGTLTSDEKNTLTEKLKDIDKQQGIQYSVVIVHSLHGVSSEETADMIGTWNKVGMYKHLGGAVIFLSKDDRSGYIKSAHMASSLEHSTIQKIYDETLTPSLKQGNYYEGINKTIDAINETEQKQFDAEMESWKTNVPKPTQDIVEKDDADDPSQADFVEAENEPKILGKLKVDYPAEAKRAKIEGKVTYSALIDKDGKVLKVSIVKSANKIFDQSVKDAVMKLHFTPAKNSNGETVKVWYTQSVSFKLHSHDADNDNDGDDK